MRAAVPFRATFQTFWGRDASVHVVCIVAIATLFAAAAYAGVHSTRYWDELFRIVMSRSELSSSQHPGRNPRQGPNEALRLLDPRDSFANARVGLLKFATHNSDMCRRVMFDNRTGSLTDAGLTACGKFADAPDDYTGQERALAMQRAFRK